MSAVLEKERSGLNRSNAAEEEAADELGLEEEEEEYEEEQDPELEESELHPGTTGDSQEEESAEVDKSQLSKGSWNSRILAVSLAAEMEQSLVRATTPLRPDDSMVDRVAADESGRLLSKRLLGAAVKSIQGTVRLKKPLKGASLGPKAFQKAKSDPHAALMKQFPEMNTPRQLKGERPLNEDDYSLHEKDVVAELNMARSNPLGYSQLMANVLLVGEPFLPANMGKVTFAQLKNYAAQYTSELSDLTSALASLEESEKKEITALKDQWAIEDAERAKKAKKAPAPKKAKPGDPAEKVVDEATLANQAIEQERDALVKGIQGRNDAEKQRLIKGIESLKQKKDNATYGTQVLEQCFARVAASPVLPKLQYSRGLSLAARDLCTAPITPTTVTQMATRYGSFPLSSANESTTVVHRGTASIRHTIMEMFLALDDPKRKARLRMLDPSINFVGCGWRKGADGTTCTTLVLSPLFEELETIAIRDYMSLTDIRRILKEAVSLNSKTVIVLQSPKTAVVQPTSHPVKCANTATVSIRCPDSISITAALYNLRDPVPKAPTHILGELFVQRNPQTGSNGNGNGNGVGQVDIHCILPYKSKFGLAIFYSDNSYQSTAAGGGSSVEGGKTSIVRGYSLLGNVEIHSDEWDIAKRGVPGPPSYPTWTSAFTERQAFLVSPLNGTLKPSQTYTFELIVPLTEYLTSEVNKVAANLAEATRISSGSREEAARLQGLADTANQALEAAIATQSQQLPTIQSDLAALTKDSAKKRGKELDKIKSQIADLEAQVKTMEQTIAEKKAELASAQERILAHRRTTRQASAQRRKYLTEQTQLQSLTDRTHPLDIELSLEERRSKLLPLDDANTKYAVQVQVPKSGRVSLFIAGTVALTWDISPL